MHRFARSGLLVRRGLAVLAATLVLLASGLSADAQQPRRAAALATLDSFKLTLDQLEASASRESLTNEALLDLRNRLGPLRDQLRARADELEPKLAEADTRLKQLGEAPEEGAPAEDPAISAERAELGKLYREIDAGLKQAKLLVLRTDQLVERITDRRRSIFTHELLHRSYSIVHPTFWTQVAEALPIEMRSIGLLLQSWSSYAIETGGASGLIGAGLALLALLIAAIALSTWWRRRLASALAPVSRFGKICAALRVLARTMLVAPLGVAVALWVFDAFKLIPDRILDIAWGFCVSVLVASFGRGVARAVFAPEMPERRLFALDDGAARVLGDRLTWGMRILGAVIFLNIVHKAIVAPVILTVATSALLAVSIAATMINGLFALQRAAVESDGQSRIQWVRFVAWIISVAIVVLVMTGHVGLSAFIAGRLLTLATICGALYLLLVLTDTIFTEILSSDTPNGRAFAAALGLRPRNVEVIGILFSGVIRIGLIVTAAFLAVGPWGILAADFFGAIEGAVFGFKIGEITFSLTAIFGALAVLLVGLALTRALQRWLQLRFLPRTGLEPSLQLSISTIIGYLGVIAAVALAMSELGIDLQKIALVAGALSVGIGFGLQSIVSNFVSGLILLAERPIRVGDSIVVKGEEGYVRRISVRATEIETFERASVIVPNSELITGVVKNWTHANTTGRIIVKVGVSYETDAEKVRDILLAVASEHPQILQTPPPRVFLTGFGDSSLDFELRCVVANVDYGLSVKSDLHFAILKQFREADIEIPYPQREVRVMHEGRSPATLVPLKGTAVRTSEG